MSDSIDMYGWREPSRDVRGMLSPVLCRRCNRIYDLTKGEPVARYSDCTVYITPCCGQQVDDRPAGLVGSPAFDKLDRQGRTVRR